MHTRTFLFPKKHLVMYIVTRRLGYKPFGWETCGQWTVTLLTPSLTLILTLTLPRRLLPKHLYVICIISERERSLFAVARPSVCRLSVCHLSVTLVHPTHAVEIFDNISMAFGTLAILWHPHKIFMEIVPGEPSIGGVRHNKDSQI